MAQHMEKTVLMQLVEHQHAGKSIEQILLDSYQHHGSERQAAKALGITQQVFNSWKFRLGITTQIKALKFQKYD